MRTRLAKRLDLSVLLSHCNEYKRRTSSTSPSWLWTSWATSRTYSNQETIILYVEKLNSAH